MQMVSFTLPPKEPRHPNGSEIRGGEKKSMPLSGIKPRLSSPYPVTLLLAVSNEFMTVKKKQVTVIHPVKES